jgi:hypothetical protein
MSNMTEAPDEYSDGERDGSGRDSGGNERQTDEAGQSRRRAMRLTKRANAKHRPRTQ